MSGVPAWQQVANELRSQITGGALGPGAQLPSMSQLREQYGVSNTVVRDALNELRREQLVVGQQGKGVFVRDGVLPAVESTDQAARIDQLEEEIRLLKDRVKKLEKR
jgi:GntR family transcriptional regulator